MKHFILVICSFSSLFTHKSNINQILISTKINGVSVKLSLDKPLDNEFVTAWFDSKTNWFYITAYQANGDKRTLEQTKIIEPIEKIEISIYIYTKTKNDHQLIDDPISITVSAIG